MESKLASVVCFQGEWSVFFLVHCKKGRSGLLYNEQALGTFVLKSSGLYVLSGERAVSV